MSYKVKPEDISDDARVMIVNAVNNADRDLESEVAAIANALIEAGLVSPPCFCVRQNGELRKFDSGEIKVFSGKPWAHDTEHYKGQTS